MIFLKRLTGLLLSPKKEWRRIATEPANGHSMLWWHLLSLFGIALLSMLVTTYNHRWLLAIYAIAFLAIYLGLMYVTLWLVGKLFSLTATQAVLFEWLVYSMTPLFLAVPFSKVPVAGEVLYLASTFYFIYLLYTGSKVLLLLRQRYAVGFTLLTLLASFIVMLLVSAALNFLFGQWAGPIQ